MAHDYRHNVQRGTGHSGSAGGATEIPGKRTLTESLSGVSAAPRAPVQRKATGAAGAGNVHDVAQRGVAEGGARLPYLDLIQRSFGAHDVSGIKAHVGGPAALACQGMGAAAYATGDHVAFAEAPDLHTAAHEAAHVVQQKAGVQLAGGIGASGDEYEQNADQVADAVVSGRSAESLLNGTGSSQQPPGQTGHGGQVGGAPAVQQRKLEARPDGQGKPAEGGKPAAGGKGAAPCAECGSGDCECPDPAKQPGAGEEDQGVRPKGDIPNPLRRYIVHSGITSPSQLSKEQVIQLGRLAKSQMGEDEIVEIGRQSGVDMPTGDPAQQQGGQGSPVQRQAISPGQAATATAGTMWWLTLVDGPLPFGDILYGILVATAAVTAAAAADSAVERICSQHLTKCLDHPWQPERNRERFGSRKDCGACYRECKLALGVWPSYKCPA